MRALADHLLGRPIVENGQVVDVRWGPQPYEAILSMVCEAFHCTPREARKQSWRDVQAIFDYRAAKAAAQMVNCGESLDGFPELRAIFDEMQTAQEE